MLSVMETMFEYNYFGEINNCEQDILATYEFDNHLNDYTELNYDEILCCQAESSDAKHEIQWTKVYYADFETDVTVSPHRPYLCFVCYGKNMKSYSDNDTASSHGEA